MNLQSGLDRMKGDLSDWDFTCLLEEQAREVTELIRKFGPNPPSSALERAYRFLIDVEKWKAMCLQQRMGMAATNPIRTVWNALKEALEAGTDRQALLAVMELKGFGS